MCGIVGFVAKDPKKNPMRRRSILSEGLWCDSLRGTGGTGVAIVQPDGTIASVKRALAGPDFLHSLAWGYNEKLVDECKIAIGHNRAATVGSVRDVNCHPFHYEGEQEIILVHNGTLSNHYSLTPTGFRHDVDSAHAAHALAATTDEMSVLKKLKGPFVLVWYNKNKNTFNIARNSFREIYYMIDKDGDFYFASEWGMIDWILTRNNVECAWKQYKSLDDDQWLEWGFDEHGVMTKPVARKIVPDKEKYPTLAREVSSWWGDHYPEDYRKKYEPQLVKLGYTEGELVWGEIDSFKPYNQKDPERGMMICTIEAEKGEIYDVEVHGLARSKYEEWKAAAGEYIGLALISARKQGKDYILTARVDVDYTEDLAGDILDAAEDDMLPGPGGVLMPRPEWKRRVHQGCAQCSNPIRDGDHDKLRWLSSTPPAVLCHACSADHDTFGTMDPNIKGANLC